MQIQNVSIFILVIDLYYFARNVLLKFSPIFIPEDNFLYHKLFSRLCPPGRLESPTFRVTEKGLQKELVALLRNNQP